MVAADTRPGPRATLANIIPRASSGQRGDRKGPAKKTGGPGALTPDPP
jgi:hypothetical protein